MGIHAVFDLAAYGTAAVAGFAYARIFFCDWKHPVPKGLRNTYSLVVLEGVMVGSFLFGTLQLTASDLHGLLGKSILGAIIGGIVAAEIFKAWHGIRGSTGAIFVPALAAGTAVGRVGCFLAGLPDHTYGIATTLPWGVDFGDGVARHPVQLYESFAMILFLIAFTVALQRNIKIARDGGFYLFVIWYGMQRFVWEFLKPYGTIVGPFNVFHLLCAALVLYGIVMLRMIETRKETV